MVVNLILIVWLLLLVLIEMLVCGWFLFVKWLEILLIRFFCKFNIFLIFWVVLLVIFVNIVLLKIIFGFKDVVVVFIKIFFCFVKNCFINDYFKWLCYLICCLFVDWFVFGLLVVWFC